jgi:hypothetical protein
MKRTVRNAKDVKRAPSDELSGAWAALRDRLAEALGVLEEGQYLVLMGARSPYYVQFAMEGDSWLLAEAVSDTFLPKERKLGKAQREALRKLGWQPPADGGRGKRSPRGPKGSPNFHRRFQGTDELADAATLSARALRDVYGFRKPASLRYHAFEGEGADILLPTLGLGRYSGPKSEAVADVPASLEEQVLAVVRDDLGAEHARFDPRGFLTLEADDALVFALLLGDPPFVRLYAPVLFDVSNEDEALRFLNVLNYEGSHSRFVLDEGTVFAVLDLPGEPFVAEHFVESFLSVASTARHLPKTLEEALGGRMPSEPKAARGRGRGRKKPASPA